MNRGVEGIKAPKDRFATNWRLCAGERGERATAPQASPKRERGRPHCRAMRGPFPLFSHPFRLTNTSTHTGTYGGVQPLDTGQSLYRPIFSPNANAKTATAAGICPASNGYRNRGRSSEGHGPFGSGRFDGRT